MRARVRESPLLRSVSELRHISRYQQCFVQRRLFEGITRHKVAWVREADHKESMTAADGDTIIDVMES